MAFALVGIGVLLFMAAYQNNVAALGTQVSSDLTGSGGFLIWVVALFIVGALGYIQPLRTVSRIFLALILVVIFLSNKGIFTTLSQVVGASENASEDTSEATPATPATPTTPTTGDKSEEKK